MTPGDARGPEGGLELVGVSKAYGGVPAVRDVSFSVRRGELVTLLGPSGSGKTTTLMMVAGFLLPDSGHIVLDGRSIAFLPPYERNMGMVFQSYALFPHMTVFENVAFPLRMRKRGGDEIRRRVGQALELVRLAAMGDRFPRQLSGGQQQRVALARALVFDPPALLMDEPLGALDRKLRDEMRGEIRRLQQALGITTLYVTHDQEEALAISDRVGIMYAGQLRAIGRPDALYERPPDSYVASFLGASNLLEAEVVDGASGRRLRLAGLGVEMATDRPVGDRVRVGLRPEKIGIGPASGTLASSKGRVDEVTYLGERVRARVAVEGGARVTVSLANSVSAVLPGTGDVVEIHWRIEDLVLLERIEP